MILGLIAALLGIVIFVLFWAVVIALIVWVVRKLTAKNGG